MGDVDAFLNLERRTGIKKDDINDFLTKVDAVDEAIRGLKDGTLDPTKEIRIPGLVSEEEKQRQEEEKRRREEERRRREEERRLRLRAEEKDKWWAGAEAVFGSRLERAKSSRQKKQQQGGQENTRRQENVSVAQRYQSDYSRWEEWSPDDPVSKEEEEERQREKERAENDAFEKANPDFCNQFKEDLEQREQAMKKKEETSDALRLKGNRYFKARQYEKALSCYMDSLKTSPWKVETLTNIAQVHLRLKAFDDAIEFTARALHIKPEHVKALSRHAQALTELGRLDEALVDLEYAITLEGASEHEDLLRQHRQVKAEVETRQAEEEVAKLKEKAGQAKLPSTPAELAKLLAGDATAMDMANLEAAGLASIDKVVADIQGGKDEALPSLAALVMASEKNAVYLRTSGTLSLLCRRLLDAKEQCNDGSSQGGHEAAARLLSVLTAAASMEGKCKAVVLEEGALLEAVDVYVGKDGGQAHCMALRMATACFTQEDCAKALSNSTMVMDRLLSCFDGRSQPSLIEGMGLAASLLSDILLKPPGQKTLSSLPESSTPCVVVARQIQVLSSNETAAKECRQSLVGVLANMALVDSMRSRFIGEPVRALLGVCKGNNTAATWAFALAGLMNACLEPSMAVREDLFKAGACGVMLSVLSANDTLRKRLPPEIWSRSAGLLSRLVAQPTARDYMSQPDKAGIVSGALLNSQDQAEKEHLVRVLAGVVGGSNARVLLHQDLVRALTRLLPQPRTDGNIVTAESVCLPPTHKLSESYAVSVTKCLIHAVDGPWCEVVCEEQGAERLVSLLANSNDGPVRKNAAIVIAKLVKRGGKVADRIRALRGMEMIVQLGNRLV